MTDEWMEGLIEGMSSILRAKDNFTSLVEAARLDPKVDFKEADWSYVDFGEADLSGYDFSGANLTGADFSKARGLDSAIFGNIVGVDRVDWPALVAPFPSIGELVSKFEYYRDAHWEKNWGSFESAYSKHNSFSEYIKGDNFEIPFNEIASVVKDFSIFRKKPLAAVPSSWSDSLPWFNFLSLPSSAIVKLKKGFVLNLEEALLITAVYRRCLIERKLRKNSWAGFIVPR